MNKNELIYEMMIKEMPLTELNLKQNGFTSEEIKEMINNQFLTEVNGEYEINSVYSFYQYGIKKITLGYINEANICFKKCLEMQPYNRTYILQQTIDALTMENYKKFFDFFPMLDTKDTEENIKDNNLYLYLACLVTKVPFEYYERAMKFDYDDLILSPDCQVDYKEEENIIRGFIAKSRYKYALKLVNDFIATKKTDIVKMLVIKEFLHKVIKVENKIKYDLFQFAQKKEYANIVYYLDTRARRRYLKSNEVYIRMLAKTMIDLLETQVIPQVTVNKTSYMYDAIKGNNFELAKNLNYYYKKKNNRESIEGNMINMLLTDIIELINQIKNEKGMQAEGPTLIKTLN